MEDDLKFTHKAAECWNELVTHLDGTQEKGLQSLHANLVFMMTHDDHLRNARQELLNEHSGGLDSGFIDFFAGRV